MDPVIAIVVAGAVLAAFVQGLTGFGYGLVALSFWAWVIDPKLAAALAVFGSLTGQIIAAVTVRRGFDWRRLTPFLAGGALGIPIGVAILPLLNIQTFKASLGMLLVLWCPAMLAVRTLPRIVWGGRGADAVAGGIGGIMCGLGGFSGTIPTLWCTLRGYQKDEQRAVIQNFNLAAQSVTMIFYLGKGLATREMLPFVWFILPAMLIPSLLGARLYTGVSEAAFRNIVLTCLTASGLVLLASSVPHLLAR